MFRNSILRTEYLLLVQARKGLALVKSSARANHVVQPLGEALRDHRELSILESRNKLCVVCKKPDITWGQLRKAPRATLKLRQSS